MLTTSATAGRWADAGNLSWMCTLYTEPFVSLGRASDASRLPLVRPYVRLHSDVTLSLLAGTGLPSHWSLLAFAQLQHRYSHTRNPLVTFHVGVRGRVSQSGVYCTQDQSESPGRIGTRQPYVRLY